MAEETKPVNPETEEKQDEELDIFIKCPCCGKNTLHKPLEIKSFLLDEYMASIMTGTPFSHTYKVYDTIDITVVQPLKQEAQRLLRAGQVLNDLLSKIDDETVKDKLRAAILMIKFYGTIKTIESRKEGFDRKIYKPAEVVDNFVSALNEAGGDVDKIVAAYEKADTVDNLSALPELMLRAVVDTHTDLYYKLLDAGFNATFWQGIELA